MSIANGSNPPEASSATRITSLWSFEVTTEDAATIVFEYEDLLALAKPDLAAAFPFAIYPRSLLEGFPESSAKLYLRTRGPNPRA